jgi:hypothetical protein
MGLFRVTSATLWVHMLMAFEYAYGVRSISLLLGLGPIQ